MKKSTELNIDLNAKDISTGRNAFHYACISPYNNVNVVKMMIENAESFKIDIEAVDKNGKNGFELAKEFERSAIVKLLYGAE